MVPFKHWNQQQATDTWGTYKHTRYIHKYICIYIYPCKLLFHQSPIINSIQC